MSTPRIVAHDGSAAVVVPAGGPAAVIAAALGRWLDSVPGGCGRDRQVVAVQRLLVAAEGMHERGITPGSADGTDRPHAPSEWLSTADVAAHLGIGAAAVAKRCRRGSIPGARRVNRTWLVPRDAIRTRNT